MHTCTPRTQKMEMGGSTVPSSSTARRVPGQPGLHDTLSLKITKLMSGKQVAQSPPFPVSSLSPFPFLPACLGPVLIAWAVIAIYFPSIFQFVPPTAGHISKTSFHCIFHCVLPTPPRLHLLLYLPSMRPCLVHKASAASRHEAGWPWHDAIHKRARRR